MSRINRPPAAVSALRQWLRSKLFGTYPQKEARAIVDRLLEDMAGLRGTDIALDPGKTIEQTVLSKIETALAGLKKHKPLAYVTGRSLFYGLDLYIDENVLIPRPETEELVAWIIETYRGSKGLEILDIGTGSGCIALSLARHLAGSVVTAIDFSEAALDVARKNARELDLPVRFLRFDILDASSREQLGNYHLVVSNPPYVTVSERQAMQRNVLDWEPEEALFVPDEDPLVYYRAILEFARRQLLPGGTVFFEINERFGQLLIETAHKVGFKETELRKDLNGKDRMIRVRNS